MVYDKAYLTGAHLFDHYVSVIIYESLATMFPRKMIMTILPNNNSHDVHESLHCDMIMKLTNKMQLYRLIYYS